MDEVDVTMSHMDAEINVLLLGRQAALENALDEVKHISGKRYCIDCDQEIPAKRLKAVPWTQRCVACQEAAEAEG